MHLSLEEQWLSYSWRESNDCLSYATHYAVSKVIQITNFKAFTKVALHEVFHGFVEKKLTSQIGFQHKLFTNESREKLFWFVLTDDFIDTDLNLHETKQF